MEGRRAAASLIISAVLLLTGTLSVTFTLNADGTESRSSTVPEAWSCYGGNYRNSRQSSISADYREARDRWEYELQGSVSCDPVVDPDNNVYFTTSMGFLYCLDTEGNREWTYNIGEVGKGSPALTNEGDIIVGSNSGDLYCISGDGLLEWSYLADGRIVSSPMIDTMGEIHFTSSDGFLYCLHKNGTLKWRSEIGPTDDSSCAVSGNRLTVVSTRDANVLCFDTDGERLWKISIGTICMSAPTIDSFGNIYIASHEEKLYKISSNGDILWEFMLDGLPPASPGIYDNEKIIISTHEGTVYCVSSIGDEIWSKSTPDVMRSDPLITEDGKVIYCSGYTLCFDMNGDPVWAWNTVSIMSICPGMGKDCVYVQVPEGIAKLGPFTPTSPGEVELEQIGGSIRVRWELPILDGGVDILGYEIERRDVQKDETRVFRSSPENPFYLDEEVIVGTRYFYNVKAYNRIGFGDRSGSGYIKVLSVEPLSSSGPPEVFASDPWPMYGRDPKHTSYFETLGTWPYFQVAWHYQGGIGWTRMPPAIDRRNVAYYCDSEGDLKAIGPDGFLLWRYRTYSSSGDCSPCLDSEGNVYFTSNDGYLYSLKSSGELRFKVRASEHVGSSTSPIITEDDKLLVGCGDHNLKCYNMEGDYLWTFDSRHCVYRPPAVDDAGNIYFLSANMYLQSVDPEGRSNWNISFEDLDDYATPSIGPQGNIISGSGPKSVSMYSPESEYIWMRNVPGDVLYPPATTPAGEIYLLLDGYYLQKFDMEGNSLFKASKWNEHRSGSMVVLSDGRILVFDGSLQCFDRYGNLLWKMLEDSDISGGAISFDGTIYALGKDNEMWALKPSDEPPQSLSKEKSKEKIAPGTIVIISASTFLSLVILITIIMVLVFRRKRRRSVIRTESKEGPKP